MDLKQQAVLVTGASRGLGRALMEGFARKGARVVGVARDAKALDAAVKPLQAQGLAVHALAYDVGDKQAIYPLVGAATALVGPVDMLVNNASILGPTPLPLRSGSGLPARSTMRRCFSATPLTEGNQSGAASAADLRQPRGGVYEWPPGGQNHGMAGAAFRQNQRLGAAGEKRHRRPGTK